MKIKPLLSRNRLNPDDFASDFLKTLTPGIIPRSDFIKWSEIENKVSRLAPYIEFYINLSESALQKKDLVGELADSLLACDDPTPHLLCAFEILGHTDTNFTTKQDDININEVSRSIKGGNEKNALVIARLLLDLGLGKVLKRNDLSDLLFGVQIGLETNRRKNKGGECFKEEVKQLLNKILISLKGKTKKEVNLKEEVRIVYGKGLSKKVDFALKVNDEYQYGFEVNFYTTSGSKPTEIKRSYGNINEQFASNGIVLIWITDGKGYREMQRSLRDAFVIFPNIYNLNQANRYLEEDLVGGLRPRST